MNTPRVSYNSVQSGVCYRQSQDLPLAPKSFKNTILHSRNVTSWARDHDSYHSVRKYRVYLGIHPKASKHSISIRVM